MTPWWYNTVSYGIIRPRKSDSALLDSQIGFKKSKTKTTDENTTDSEMAEVASVSP